jgi:hypothetical protein
MQKQASDAGAVQRISCSNCNHTHSYTGDRLTTLYQVLHDAIHGKSGQSGTLKLQYIRTEKESVLGWVRISSHIIRDC